MRNATGPAIGRTTAWGLTAAMLMACPQALADGDPAAAEPFTIGRPSPDFTASTPLSRYGAMVRAAVSDALLHSKQLRSAQFQADIEISIAADGKIAVAAIKRGTGDDATDDLIRQAIAVTPALGAPPPNLPPVVYMRIKAGRHV